MLVKKQALTHQNVLDQLGRHMLADLLPYVLDIEKSSGNHLYDGRTQRQMLDCFTFIASNPLGYNHPKLNDPNFEKKLLRVAKLKVSNSDLATLEMGEFVETFSQIALPQEMKYLFFVEGGALAVENAMKTAFDWKVRLNFARGIKEERGTKIIHLREAFHGRSGYTLSVTNTDPRKTKYFPKFDWPRVTNPKVIFPLEKHLAEIEAAEKQSLAEVEHALKVNDGDVAAILLETIQGEGGDNHFRPEYHQALRVLADKYEAMLIYDEVQCGMGLTGKMWAYQHYGVTPDIVAFGKKAQVCGIMVGPRVELAADNVFVEASRINSTWGGNIVDMVRCQRFLEIIEEDGLVDNATVVGRILTDKLHELQSNFSNIVSNVRGRGLMCAFDLPNADARKQFLSNAAEFGAIILGSGDRSVRLRPSLTFSDDNVQELMEILKKSAAKIAG